MIKEKGRRNIFCCYSIDLKDFLHNNGINYDLCALNPNSKNMFWAYIRCEELDNALKQWTVSKKQSFYLG